MPCLMKFQITNSKQAPSANDPNEATGMGGTDNELLFLTC